jgi:hypothetical protein
MNFYYGSTDIATPAGRGELNQYYTGLRTAMNTYHQLVTERAELRPGQMMRSVHEGMQLAATQVEETLANTFPVQDPTGASTFLRESMRTREFSPYFRDMLGGVAIQGLYLGNGYDPDTCIEAAAAALGDPEIRDMEGSCTMGQFLVALREPPSHNMPLGGLGGLIATYSNAALRTPQ